MTRASAARRRCRPCLIVLSAAVSSCGGTPRPAPSAPPSNVQATARQIPHIMVFAGPPAGWTVTPAPPESREAPQPAAGYLSLSVACDSVEALMKRTLTRNPALRVSRADGVPVDFGFGGPPRSGCELKSSGKFIRTPADSAPHPTQTQDEPSTLGDGFQRAGWVDLRNYQADGPDGEDEGWRSKETTCVARWSWDGGDDGDSTYVPSDDWALEVGCVPSEPADLPRD